MGTTIKAAGSQAAFRVVVFDAVVARALRLALAQSGPAVDIIESGALQRLGTTPPRWPGYFSCKGRKIAALVKCPG